MRIPGERQAGYALLSVVVVVALLAIALAAAAPSALVEGQREREEELIFRGEQYRRAIGLYYRKFGRLPFNVEDLLHTSELSFLRRPWPDPVSPSGEWRLIYVGPSGELVGSEADVTIDLQSIAGGRGNTAQSEQRGRGSNPQAPTPPQRPSGGLSPAAGTAPLIGVGSSATGQSFHVYNEHDSYGMWEFIFDPVQDAVRRGQQGQGAGQQGQGQGQGQGRGTDRPPPGTSGSPRTGPPNRPPG